MYLDIKIRNTQNLSLLYFKQFENKAIANKLKFYQMSSTTNKHPTNVYLFPIPCQSQLCCFTKSTKKKLKEQNKYSYKCKKGNFVLWIWIWFDMHSDNNWIGRYFVKQRKGKSSKEWRIKGIKSPSKSRYRFFSFKVHFHDKKHNKCFSFLSKFESKCRFDIFRASSYHALNIIQKKKILTENVASRNKTINYLFKIRIFPQCVLF